MVKIEQINESIKLKIKELRNKVLERLTYNNSIIGFS